MAASRNAGLVAGAQKLTAQLRAVFTCIPHAGPPLGTPPPPPAIQNKKNQQRTDLQTMSELTKQQLLRFLKLKHMISSP